MFTTIVLGTSLSDTSTRTLCCLRGLQAAGARKVLLIHAMNIRDVGTLYRQLRQLALPSLEHQTQILRDMGFEVEADIRLGLPYFEIQQIAQDHDASLIAVHLTTESLLATAFVGGVAYEVIQRADRPVLAMKAAFTEDGPPGRHRRPRAGENKRRPGDADGAESTGCHRRETFRGGRTIRRCGNLLRFANDTVVGEVASANAFADRDGQSGGGLH